MNIEGLLNSNNMCAGKILEDAEPEKILEAIREVKKIILLDKKDDGRNIVLICSRSMSMFLEKRIPEIITIDEDKFDANELFAPSTLLCMVSDNDFIPNHYIIMTFIDGMEDFMNEDEFPNSAVIAIKGHQDELNSFLYPYESSDPEHMIVSIINAIGQHEFTEKGVKRSVVSITIQSWFIYFFLVKNGYIKKDTLLERIMIKISPDFKYRNEMILKFTDNYSVIIMPARSFLDATSGGKKDAIHKHTKRDVVSGQFGL